MLKQDWTLRNNAIKKEIQSYFKSLTTIVLGEQQPYVIPMNTVRIAVENEMSAMVVYLTVMVFTGIWANRGHCGGRAHLESISVIHGMQAYFWNRPYSSWTENKLFILSDTTLLTGCCFSTCVGNNSLMQQVNPWSEWSIISYVL